MDGPTYFMLIFIASAHYIYKSPEGKVSILEAIIITVGGLALLTSLGLAFIKYF